VTTRRHIRPMPESLEAYLADEFASERDSLAESWDALENVTPSVEVDSARKAEVRAAILRAASIEPGSRTDRRPVPLRVYRFTQYAVAAMILALVGLSFLLSPSVQTYRAPRGAGAGAQFVLADGSSVTLAAGSSLSLTSDFGEGIRRVALRGEAYFEVQSATVPFVIDTYNARTRVVGTGFSVRAWPTEIDAGTKVQVAHGVVTVSPRGSAEAPLRLQAGEATSVIDRSSEPSAPEAIDVDHAFVWTQGGFEYRNEPIGNVLSDLERRFDIQIEAPSDLRLRPISIFNQTDGTLEEILGDISATIGVQYRRIAGGYELYPV